MFKDIVHGDTLYAIGQAMGLDLGSLIVIPGPDSSGGVWSGAAQGILRPGDQVFGAAGPSITISGPSETLYSIARAAGVDQWQDLQVLRDGSLYGAANVPTGLQPGDQVLIPHRTDCCGEGEVAATPTSEAEEAATAEGSAQDVDRTTAECDQKRVIVIDPGHGGTANVSGSSWNNATSVSGALEKTLTLRYARVLKAALETPESLAQAAQRGYCDLDVFLTRDADVNMTPTARRAVAADNGADIFVSLHFNGNASASPRGVETYYRTPGTAGQSNASADMTLASLVNNAIYASMLEFDSGARNRGAKTDLTGRSQGISVTRDAGVGLSGNMSRSILIETEFITNNTVDDLYVSGPSADANIRHIMAGAARALIQGL